MSTLAFVALTVAFAGLGHADPTLHRQSLLGGRVFVLVPDGFELMSEERLKVKYPSERRPTTVYTNDRGTVNLALHHTKDRMPSGAAREVHQAMDGTFRRLYPSATWFRSEIVEINGRQWFLLDLRTPAIDTEIRNIMLGTSLDGRLLLLSFNVTEELEAEWLPAAHQIVQSVTVK